jgi:hypothetical protein
MPRSESNARSSDNGRLDLARLTSTAMRVWLDDRRSPPSAEWVWVRTPEETIDLLRGGKVEELSLDHDLGLGIGDNEQTGYDVLLWIEEQIGTGVATFRLPELKVHSANAPAHERMDRAIASIRRLAGVQ